ncbi:hypothetical protein [Streptomyces sp. NPDC018059]|uniref:hypothetical protein n=1 Tax=Streptomyces sp. NPDC018059 TaxID=3365041 RepID=UPI0037A19141
MVAETTFNGRGLTYTHDAAGRLTSRTNGAGETVRYERDVFGQVSLARSADDTTSSTYDAAGRRTSRSTPSGTVSSWQYDAADRPLSLVMAGTRMEFQHDAAGHEICRSSSNGWFDKHRLDSDVQVPRSVENRLKGGAVKFMRRTGRIGPRGTEDISGDKWKRPRLKGSCR